MAERWTKGGTRARQAVREVFGERSCHRREGSYLSLEDLVRRCCSGRDAQGRPHVLAGRHSLNSPEALLPEDIEKHVQIQLCEIDVVCYLETRKSKQMVGIEALASRRIWACGHG